MLKKYFWSDIDVIYDFLIKTNEWSRSILKKLFYILKKLYKFILKDINYLIKKKVQVSDNKSIHLILKNLNNIKINSSSHGYD